ncbi:MAG: sulfatase-like hydrolase/transferase [Myxococcota bacterium]|nr:sulfatase-like hydrolase/transferase [Myxococcota bacterium]
MLVSIDTLRADHVGCYGARRAHTPHLDSLATRGVRFDVALSPAPLTLPAHASLMTGVDPPRHGVRHNSVHRLGAELPTLAERLAGAGYATAAFVGSLVLDRRFGLARGFAVYDDRTGGGVSASTGYAERPADQVADAVLAWLAEAPDRFFLWVHFYDPHASYAPPPGFASAFASHPYAGEIAFTDAQLGRILAAIEARWGETGTLVVATSDHGESLGEHEELTHSYTIYEATQRIPLILAGPGLPEGVVAPGPVALVDVAPTLLALAGAPALEESRGRDLREALAEGGSGSRPIYMETLAPHLDFGWSALFGLRSGDWKYIRAPRRELYALGDDPRETRDRAAAEPERVAELDALLEGWLGAQQQFAGPARVAPEDRARLRSLGYVVPEEPAALDGSTPLTGPDPKDRMSVLLELGRAQAALDGGKAAEALARLDALEEASLVVVAHRAAAALAAGNPERAAAEARAVLAAEPSRTDMRILLARALAAQGLDAEAGRALAALPTEVAPAPWVALGAARAELAEGRPEAALRRLEWARTRHPEDPALARAQAELLEAQHTPAR